MSIKICPDCGGMVSEARNDCIHCGHLFNPKQKKNIALICLWVSFALTAVAYLVNVIIALRVGGTLKWMFEYIEYGYIAGFICMGIGIIGFITSLILLNRNEQTKSKTKTSRIISLILMIVLLFVTISPAIFYNPITYDKYDDNTYIVRHFNRNYSGDIKIPSTYKGLPVERIGDSAFAYCSNITSVEIGEGITIISNFYGFYGCTSLESVVIPASTTCIGFDAFSGCTSLKSVYYKGTEESWKDITIVCSEISDITRYYYSEGEPTKEGNYWHYDTDGNIAVWQ